MKLQEIARRAGLLRHGAAVGTVPPKHFSKIGIRGEKETPKPNKPCWGSVLIKRDETGNTLVSSPRQFPLN